MPRVRIVYDVDGWAYHHQARALRTHAPPDFEVTIAPLRGPDGADHLDRAIGEDPVDLAFDMHTGAAPARLVHGAIVARGWRPVIVGGWYAGWPLKIEEFAARRALADALVFNNQLTWDRMGRPPRTWMLPNGVDLEVFRVTRPLDTRSPRVVWVGSQLWRAVKGYDDYLVPLARQLARRGITCDFRLVDSKSGGLLRAPAEMAAWYNTATVLVCASEAEGTPNPALEAAACGCVVVSTRVGNMPELIRNDENGYLVDRHVEALAAGVERAIAHYPRLAHRMLADIRAWSWAERARPYFALFRELLGAPRR